MKKEVPKHLQIKDRGCNSITFCYSPFFRFKVHNPGLCAKRESPKPTRYATDKGRRVKCRISLAKCDT